ncbi:hypothetical protein H8959_008452 [Pygathrix nigripes]
MSGSLGRTAGSGAGGGGSAEQLDGLMKKDKVVVFPQGDSGATPVRLQQRRVYLNGEFVRGCDILLQMHQNGDLVEEQKKLGIHSALLDEKKDQDSK